MTSFKQSIILEGVQYLVFSKTNMAEKFKVYIFRAPFVVTAQTSSFSVKEEDYSGLF